MRSLRREAGAAWSDDDVYDKDRSDDGGSGDSRRLGPMCVECVMQ